MGNDNRNQVIIDEIKHWKQNKLLPAEYCDFLLALYTYGEGVEESASTKRDLVRNSLFLYADVVLLILLLPISLFLLVFFQYDLWIEMVIFLGMMLLIAGHLYWYNKKHQTLIHIPIMLLFLVLLIATISLFHTLFGQGVVLISTIFFHCIIWVVVGIIYRYYYLVASGVIGTILLLTIMFL
ncbi:cation transport ATPase [Alkalibacillus filiformis]|uniref:Cation transport ATPase n=1 Tax=Alkalibacillus filiformis TaxID=200990 RepID=A0ABU0DRH2_9BACI|nr:hypothetical protein [Alkalibacillus filiformis]MDQ0351047.1 cation transport ATPase [Alkalibacillus filiformis]